MEICLCEKCEWFCFKEAYDYKLNLCSLCKDEINDNDPPKDKETSRSEKTISRLHFETDSRLESQQ